MTAELLLTLSVPLVFLAGLATLVIALFRRATTDAHTDPGIGVLRRLSYYVPGLSALGVAASGITLALQGLLDVIGGERTLAGNEAALALALALMLVGVPLWLFLWSLAQRSVRQHPVEAGALIRKLYVYLVLGGSAAIAAGSLGSALGGALGAGRFSLGDLALPIVMAGVWTLHWRSEAVEGQPSGVARLTRRLYIYFTAGYGLIMLCVGAGATLASLLTSAYDAAAAIPLLGADGVVLWSREARDGAAFALVGGVWWAWHWFRAANADGPSDVRQLYLYLTAAFGGAITTVIALSLIIQGALIWTLGGIEAPSAAAHFRLLPDALPPLVFGAGVWGYHAAVLHGESGTLTGGLSAVRVYRHLAAAVGLVALGGGLVLLLGAAVGILTPQPGTALAGGGWWKEPFSWGVTLTLIGGALWGRYWWTLQRAAAARPAEERGSQSRRSYLYGAAGAAVLIALGNLSGLLFVLLRDLLEGRLSASALHDGKWAIAALLMAGAIGVYHWLTLRQDREFATADAEEEALTEAPAVRPKSVVVLAANEAPARGIEARLGYGVQWWRAEGGLNAPAAIADADFERAAREIAESPGERALVLVDGGAIRVVPYV